MIEFTGSFRFYVTGFISLHRSFFSLRLFHSQVEYEIKYVDTIFLPFLGPIIRYNTLSINSALAKSLLSDCTIDQVFLFSFRIFGNKILGAKILVDYLTISLD